MRPAKIIGVENNGEIVTCEPGVVLDDLNKYLSEYGRKIGPDPSSSNRAVVRGCVGNNATGAHSLQYGHTGDYVESVDVVLANGDIVTLSTNFEPQKPPDDKASGIAKECLHTAGGMF